MKGAGKILTWLFLGSILSGGAWNAVKWLGIVPKQAPQFINADGETHTACKGFVHVSNDAGWGAEPRYEVTYTDSDGLEHTIRGIKNLEVADVPDPIDAPFPTEDERLSLTDGSGKPYVDGRIYTWPDGNKALRQNGQWVLARVKNDWACPAPHN